MTYSPFPTGVILPFGGSSSSVPDGWLLCNGASLLRTLYVNLFAAIGTAWGAADGSHFNLPDLQGRFLRGVDNGTGRDPDAGTRIASNTGGNTGNNVGTVQGIATSLASGTQSGTKSTSGLTVSSSNFTPTGSIGYSDLSHTHSGSTSYVNGGNPGNDTITEYGGGGASVRAFSYNQQPQAGNQSWQQHSHTFGTSTASLNHNHSFSGNAGAVSTSLGAADNETRPINVYVHYIIKD